MKKLLASILLLGSALALAASVSAQQLSVAAGSKGLTYDRELQEINKFCSATVALTPVETNGSVKNMEMLVGNEVQGVWTQADILYMMAKSQDLSNIKTLLVLHKEQLHFIVRSDFSVKQGGVMGVGGTAIPIREITQIGGMNVAAAGGALWTARQVRLDSEIPFNIVEADSSALAVKAVLDGKAHVALVVGGQPLDMLKDMKDAGRNLRILRIPEAVQKKISGVYLADKVTYTNLTDSAGVDTVYVQALFVVREYKTDKMQKALAALRGCVLDKLDEIKETPKTHAAWQTVKAEDQAKAKWPLYQLPAVGKK